MKAVYYRAAIPLKAEVGLAISSSKHVSLTQEAAVCTQSSQVIKLNV